MAEGQDGFEIRGRFYPWAQQMRMLDPLLVTEVTGMSYNDFLQVWQGTLDGDEVDVDPVVMNGLIAVAIWQQHTDWTRARVVKFMERLAQEDLDLTGSEEEVDASPPPSDNASSASATSSMKQSASSNGRDASWEVSSQSATGTLRSDEPSPV